MNDVSIQYYAVLREQAGRSAERVETSAATPADLYAERREVHRFTLPVALLRVAVNDEFCEWTRPLRNGDRVVFIPPVAGG
jgi:molybdopterin converting factor small subunit